jgi:hypothetical protein
MPPVSQPRSEMDSCGTEWGYDDIIPLYDYLTDPQTGRIADGIINQVKNKGEVNTYIVIFYP